MITNVGINGLLVLQFTADKLSEQLEVIYGGSSSVLYTIMPTAVPYKPQDNHFRFCSACIRIAFVVSDNPFIKSAVYYLCLFMKTSSNKSLVDLSSIRLISSEDFKTNMCYKVDLISDTSYRPNKQYENVASTLDDTTRIAGEVSSILIKKLTSNAPKDVI